MAGYLLSEGEFDNRELTDDEIWSVFSSLFSNKSKNTSSYKYGFFKSIIDNLYNVDENNRLSFDQIFSKFTEIYWNLILKYGIRQNRDIKNNGKTYLEQIVFKTISKYEIVTEIPFESLEEKIQTELVVEVKNKCKRYVIGALFEDTKRIFYSFSKKEEWVEINPQVHSFICRNRLAIEKINYYEWAKFLERINNDDVTIKLLSKLDNITKRSNLSVYRDILFYEFEEDRCFYCGKKIDICSVEVDHFIPWSFVKDDQLWNLVLSCASCNRSKSDKLPTANYVDDIIKRNERFISNGVNNTSINKLREIYCWAEHNGYSDKWRPKEMKDKDSKRVSPKSWVREEVIILVYEYFRNKDLTRDKLNEVYAEISAFLRHREFKISGIVPDEVFRDVAGITMQSARIRCLDPKTDYSGMKGTKLQKEVVKEYLLDPLKIEKEAKQIYEKYK